jgi:predicted TPR repeat methyltransferase
MQDKFLGEVRVREDKFQNSLEIVVPHGLSHKEISKITLGELLSKFRPSGCGTCLSGQDFRIRERFDRVLPVDITTGKFHVG